jgi:hypothetical protein
VSVAVGKFRSAVTKQLESLRTQSSQLDENMLEWASTVKTKLEERSRVRGAQHASHQNTIEPTTYRTHNV